MLDHYNVSQERYQVIHAFGGETIRLSEEPAIAKVLDETDGDFVAAIKALRDARVIIGTS